MPVTRSYLTLSFLTTVGWPRAHPPFSVYYNSHLIFKKGQLWRLFTNFFFFGSLGMDFVFHMFFLSRYCRLLEEGTSAPKRDFSGCFFGSAPRAAPFINIQFLGASLTFMMVYVWGRRNQYVNMSFLGLLHRPLSPVGPAHLPSPPVPPRSSTSSAWPRDTPIITSRTSTRR